LETTPASHPRLVGLAAIGVWVAHEAMKPAVLNPSSMSPGSSVQGVYNISVDFTLNGRVLHAQVQGDDVQFSARVDGDHAVVARALVHLKQDGPAQHVLIGVARDAPDAVIIVTPESATLIEGGVTRTYPFPTDR
jgi:hypothetical protein